MCVCVQELNVDTHTHTRFRLSQVQTFFHFNLQPFYFCKFRLSKARLKTRRLTSTAAQMISGAEQRHSGEEEQEAASERTRQERE